MDDFEIVFVIMLALQFDFHIEQGEDDLQLSQAIEAVKQRRALLFDEIKKNKYDLSNVIAVIGKDEASRKTAKYALEHFIEDLYIVTDDTEVKALQDTPAWFYRRKGKMGKPLPLETIAAEQILYALEAIKLIDKCKDDDLNSRQGAEPVDGAQIEIRKPDIEQLVRDHKKYCDWDFLVLEEINSMNGTTQEKRVERFCSIYDAPKSIISSYKNYQARDFSDGKIRPRRTGKKKV